MGTVRLRTDGQAEGVAFAPDGKTLLTGRAPGSVCFWELTTGKLVRTLKLAHQGELTTIALSPDGKTLATGHDEGVRLWNVATGQEVRRMKTGIVASLAFSPDGRLLLCGSSVQFFTGRGDSNVRVFDVERGQQRLQLSHHKARVTFLACSPDGRTLVSADASEGKVCVTDVKTGELRRSFPEYETYLSAVALSPDGRTVAVGDSRGFEMPRRFEESLWLVDVETGNRLRKLEARLGGLDGVAFSPDGKTLVSISLSTTIQFWDVANGKELRAITLSHDRIGGGPLFAPDGKTLVTLGPGNSTIQLWDVATGKGLRSHEGHQGNVGTVAFSPDGQKLASGSNEDYTVRLWDARTGKWLRTMPHPEPVKKVVFLPDGTLVSASGDRFIRFWNAAEGREIRRLGVEGEWKSTNMSLSADGKVLFAFFMGYWGGPDADVISVAWNVLSGKQLYQRREPSRVGFHFAAVSRDGKMIAASKYDVIGQHQGVAVTDAMTGKELRTITGSTADGLWGPLAFSPDGKRLAVQCAPPKQRERDPKDYTWGVRLYDLATGRYSHHWPLDGSLAFSPDSGTLALGGNHVRLYDTDSGKEFARFSDADLWCLSLAFSSDGKRLATGLSNTSVLVWEVPGKGR